MNAVHSEHERDESCFLCAEARLASRRLNAGSAPLKRSSTTELLALLETIRSEKLWSLAHAPHGVPVFRRGVHGLDGTRPLGSADRRIAEPHRSAKGVDGSSANPLRRNSAHR